MKQLALAAALAAGLSACGGGSDSSTGAATAQSATPSASASYKLGKPSVNDFETHDIKWEDVTVGGETRSGSFRETGVTTQAGTDGSFTKAVTSNVRDDIRLYTDYTAEGAVKSVINNCQTAYTPAFAVIPGTLQPGQGWETSSTRTCPGEGRTDVPVTSKGAVEGIETVTVAAGTFSAVKTVHTVTRKETSGTVVRTATCWRDTATGIQVKCENKDVGTPNNPEQRSFTQTIVSELRGYAHTATGRQHLSVNRFDGDWQVWFKGSSDGICTVRIVDGAATGNCSNNYGIGFGITGSVDAQGVARFGLTGGLAGNGFSGTFESPLKISGTWSAGTDSGTWYMTHN